MRAREFIREQLAPLAKAAAPVVLPAIQQGIKRVLPALGGLGAGLELGKLTSTDTATDNPPKKGFKLVIQGPPGIKLPALTIHHSLTKVFPQDYPNVKFGTPGTPQERVLDQLQKTEKSVVKSGIPSMDMAETYRQKLCSYDFFVDEQSRVSSEPPAQGPYIHTANIPLTAVQIQEEPIKEGIRR